MFQIGDRVCSIVNHPDNNECIVVGSAGTIVDIDGIVICVEWDEYVNGHSCDGSAKYGYGWNLEQHQIELENDGVQYEFDEEKFKQLIGILK